MKTLDQKEQPRPYSGQVNVASSGYNSASNFNPQLSNI